MPMLYHTSLNENQRTMLRLIFPPVCAALRRHDPFDILEAIFFIVYTGCQWSRLPMGYGGAFKDMPLEELGISLECIKSNYGTSGFVPVAGRWVVERTISWLQTYRRLMRNYEKYLRTAGHMTLPAMIFFMLRYFA